MKLSFKTLSALLSAIWQEWDAAYTEDIGTKYTGAEYTATCTAVMVAAGWTRAEYDAELSKIINERGGLDKIAAM